MSSPVRRAFELLRQHFLLLSGPWLGVCAVGFVIFRAVQQILLRAYPVFDPRTLRGQGYVTMNQALSSSMRANFLRNGIGECVPILQGAFEVAALAVMVLLIAHVTKYGDDTFSAALHRLAKAPAVAGNLLKFYVIGLILSLGTTLVGALPVVIVIPVLISMNLPPSPPKWLAMLTAYLVMLLFALCVMPFLLNLIWRLLRPTSPDDEAPDGLLKRAFGYAAVVVSAEFVLGLMARPWQVRLGTSPPVGALIGQNLIGLAVNLITSVPTIVCVVAITLMVMDAAQPVAEAELA